VPVEERSFCVTDLRIRVMYRVALGLKRCGFALNAGAL
jgi:hypothetical protein